MRRRWVVGALAGGVAGCVLENRDPPSRELLAVRYLMAVREAEEEYRRVAGRYGSEEEIALGVSRRVRPGWVAKVMEAYEFRVEASEEAFQVYVRLKRSDLARRTFFLDETGVMRESWGPEAASAASGEVR